MATEIFYASEMLLDVASERDDFENTHAQEKEVYEAGAEIDLMCRELMAEKPDLTYEKALGIVRKENPELFKTAFPKKWL